MNDIDRILEDEERAYKEMEEKVEKYSRCSKCNQSFTKQGKLYWYKDKLYCKYCLISVLLADGVIFGNWFTNN